MWKFSEEYLLCNKFDFEVPLEDLYPQNYLHPKIKLMYDQALSCFKNGNITLEILLAGENESPQDRLDLKEILLNLKRPKLNGSPQSFLWLIEHFLGLLPIPLLPSHMNGNNFNWFLISQECKLILNEKNYKGKDTKFDYCDRCIHHEITKLPPQHKLLLNEHIEFMRSISVFDRTKRKRSIVYYSKYFTASLILRPFRSGLNENSEKEYYSLIMYMVLRWPHIRKILVESSLTAISEKTESETSSIESSQSLAEIKRPFNLKKRINMNSRFCSSFNSVYSKDSKSEASLVCSFSNDRVSKITEEFSSIRTTSQVSQITDEEKMNKIKRTQKIMKPTYHKAEIHNELSGNEHTERNNDITNISKGTGNGNESMIESAEKAKSQKEILNDNETIIECSVDKDHRKAHTGDNLKNLHKNDTGAEQIPPLIQGDHKNSELNSKITCTNQEMEESKPKFRNIESESTPPCKNTESITIDSNVLRRISKVGWTYTPPKNVETQPNFNNQAKNLSDDEMTNQDLIRSSQSESTLKKYPRVKSFKSRLSFLRIGRKKKNDNKILKTNFKYTKINS